MNGIFIEAVRDHNLRIAKSSLVKKLSRFTGQICEVSGINTNTEVLRCDSICLHFLENGDCIGNTRLKYIIGID